MSSTVLGTFQTVTHFIHTTMPYVKLVSGLLQRWEVREDAQVPQDRKWQQWGQIHPCAKAALNPCSRSKEITSGILREAINQN